MTDKEKAIVMAYTGKCMLAGNKFQIFHKYVEDIMNRPIMTHEIGFLADEIKEKSKADFMALCANENNVEEEQEPKTGHWIDDKCSVCGKGTEDLIASPEWYRDEEPNFCPFCGIRLVNSQSKREET